MAVNVKEPSSTAELGPIDSAELVYSIGFHCGVFPFCFSSFLLPPRQQLAFRSESKSFLQQFCTAEVTAGRWGTG